MRNSAPEIARNVRANHSISLSDQSLASRGHRRRRPNPGQINCIIRPIPATTGQINCHTRQPRSPRFPNTLNHLSAAAKSTASAKSSASPHSAAASLTLAVHEVYLPRPKLPVDGPRGIQARFAFEAALNQAASASLTATLVNDVASY